MGSSYSALPCRKLPGWLFFVEWKRIAKNAAAAKKQLRKRTLKMSRKVHANTQPGDGVAGQMFGLAGALLEFLPDRMKSRG
jgi:hypothetical protein